MDDYDKVLKQAETRFKKAAAATNIIERDEGKFLIEYINERISTLVNKMTAPAPMDDRSYLSTHGAIRELQTLSTMLYSNASQLNTAKEEIDALRQDTSA